MTRCARDFVATVTASALGAMVLTACGASYSDARRGPDTPDESSTSETALWSNCEDDERFALKVEGLRGGGAFSGPAERMDRSSIAIETSRGEVITASMTGRLPPPSGRGQPYGWAIVEVRNGVADAHRLRFFETAGPPGPDDRPALIAWTGSAWSSRDRGTGGPIDYRYIGGACTSPQACAGRRFRALEVRDQGRTVIVRGDELTSLGEYTVYSADQRSVGDVRRCSAAGVAGWIAR